MKHYFAEESIAHGSRQRECTVCAGGGVVGVGVESFTVVFLGRHFLFTTSDTFAVGLEWHWHVEHAGTNFSPLYVASVDEALRWRAPLVQSQTTKLQTSADDAPRPPLPQHIPYIPFAACYIPRRNNASSRR